VKTTATAIKLGVFLAVTGLAVVYLGVLLSDTRVEGQQTKVTALFEDVSYLRVGDPVRVAGVRVGQVGGIQLRPDATVSVTMDVYGTPALTDGTQAAIKYKNLNGDRYVELADGQGTGRPLAAGESIPMTHTRPALDMDALVGGFQPLFKALSSDQVNQLSGSLIQVLQGESGALSSFLASVSSVTSSLADRDQLIGSVIGNLNSTLRTFDQHDAQVSDLIVQARDLVTGLNSDRGALTGALTHVNDLTATAAQLLPVLRPDLNADIRDLGQVSKTLDANQADVNNTLRALPQAYKDISRIGVYGNFFNAYLCSVRVRLTGPTGDPVYTPWIDSSVPRCQDKPGS
jgi:phospholipid/cholesterol/gamma-HCH transport system substrate-binding protein